MLNAVGEQGERWVPEYLKGRGPAEREVAAAECFLTGPGAVEELEAFFYD